MLLKEFYFKSLFYENFWLFLMSDDMDRITIETGMQDISSGTCIKFVPRTHEANFLDIQPRYGYVWWLHMAFTRNTCLDLSIYIVILVWWFCIVMTHVIFVLYPKLLVISGADWRKPDPVTTESWVHVVRSGRPWIHACSWLCTWAVPLRPRSLRHNCMEKHRTRLGWMITCQYYTSVFRESLL